MVFEPHGIRTRVAHFFSASAWEEANQRLFRDWLRTHPEDAAQYARAKEQAAKDAAGGSRTYNAGKTAIIQQIVDRARTALGLPLVDAYDKERSPDAS